MSLVTILTELDGTYSMYKVLLYISGGEQKIKLGPRIANFKTNQAAVKYSLQMRYIIMESE